jgi:WD40 repeat protein
MDVDLPYRVVSVADLSGEITSLSIKLLLSSLYCDIGHDGRAWHVAWNPAKPLLATCSADKSVRLYAYTSDPSPNCVLHTSIPTGHTKTVRGIAWSPSGHPLATASFDANIGIWQREDQEDPGEEVGGEWECVTILEGHETECKSVAWSPTGTFLASCSRDKTVWVWEGVSSQATDSNNRSSNSSTTGRRLRMHGRTHGTRPGCKMRGVASERGGRSFSPLCSKLLTPIP